METTTNHIAFDPPPKAGQSAEIGAIAKALASAQAKIQAAAKGSTNPHFKSKYADLAEVWAAGREPLTSNGLAVTQLTECNADDMYLITTIMHESGQWVRGVYLVRPQKGDPQGYGSAITYARRYAFAAAVGIVADDDDDGNAASRANAPRQATNGYANGSANGASNGNGAAKTAPAASTDERVGVVIDGYAKAKNEAEVEAVKSQAVGMNEERAFSKDDRVRLSNARNDATTRLRGAAA